MLKVDGSAALDVLKVEWSKTEALAMLFFVYIDAMAQIRDRSDEMRALISPMVAYLREPSADERVRRGDDVVAAVDVPADRDDGGLLQRLWTDAAPRLPRLGRRDAM